LRAKTPDLPAVVFQSCSVVSIVADPQGILQALRRIFCAAGSFSANSRTIFSAMDPAAQNQFAQIRQTKGEKEDGQRRPAPIIIETGNKKMMGVLFT
jgi:hypothetical protein